MRQVLLVAVFGLVSGCSSPPPSTTQPSSGEASSPSSAEAARQELEAVFARRIRATREKDSSALIAQVHSEYAAHLPNGQRVDYEQIIAYLRRGTEQFIEVKELSIDIESLKLRGDEALVDVRQRFLRTQRLSDGSVHEVFTTVLQAETWARTPDGWKLKQVSDLREQQFMVDGQPVAPGGGWAPQR